MICLFYVFLMTGSAGHFLWGFSRFGEGKNSGVVKPVSADGQGVVSGLKHGVQGGVRRGPSVYGGNDIVALQMRFLGRGVFARCQDKGGAFLGEIARAALGVVRCQNARGLAASGEEPGGVDIHGNGNGADLRLGMEPFPRRLPRVRQHSSRGHSVYGDLFLARVSAYRPSFDKREKNAVVVCLPGRCSDYFLPGRVFSLPVDCFGELVVLFPRLADHPAPVAGIMGRQFADSHFPRPGGRHHDGGLPDVSQRQGGGNHFQAGEKSRATGVKQQRKSDKGLF